MEGLLQAAFCWLAFALAGRSVESTAGAAEPEDMVWVPAGESVRFLREEPDPAVTTVPAFWVDRFPVTKGAYLEFVRDHSEWQRSRVRRLFADPGYLAGWVSDLRPGPEDRPGLGDPVTQVSWFAARAYASWRERRLPSTIEWERVAAIGFTNTNGALDGEFRAALERWYTGVVPAQPATVGRGRANLLGVHDLHGLIWEWTSDFNSLLVTGDARNDAGLDRSLFCAGGALLARDRGDYATFMRYGFRSSLKAAYTVHNLGFRCARDP